MRPRKRNWGEKCKEDSIREDLCTISWRNFVLRAEKKSVRYEIYFVLYLIRCKVHREGPYIMSSSLYLPASHLHFQRIFLINKPSWINFERNLERKFKFNLSIEMIYGLGAGGLMITKKNTSFLAIIV